ncbi:MAG TPA: prolyl oligopeptidase family serine peptidase [Dehalococcoidia bacterium]|nr:prolyl oligopeptidase family serine peptidase [Dehalococcoidia bacterium]
MTATPTAAGQSLVTATAADSVASVAPDGRTYVITNARFDALPGARALYGVIAGAAYEIEVPQNWNDELVLYAHGFTGDDPIVFVQMPPLRNYFIAHGFAWAASSYATSGYNPEQGLRDTLALRDAFIQQVGAPQRTYIDGTSMGGHVVVSAMEQRPELFAGGFSECGVVAGVEELDYLVSYSALAAYVTNTPLPITDRAAFLRTVRSRLLPALGPAARPTQAGQQFEALVESLTGGPRPWRHEGFLDRRAGNFEVTASEDPQHLSLAARAATNVGVQYTADSASGIDVARLNALIPRLPADPSVRNAAAHPDFAPRTGKLKAPLLTLHTTGDHFVPISLEQDYRRIVDTAGAGNLLVQRAVRRPDHCQFSSNELERGFGDLVNWVEHGVKPAGDDLSNPDLRNAGLNFTDPLLPGDPGGE